MKRCSTLYIIRELQIKTVRHHYISRMAKILKNGQQWIWKWNFKFDERHGYKYPRSSTNSKNDETLKKHILKFSIDKHKERKNLESIKKEMICFIQELISNIISRFLIRTFGDQKTMNPYIQRAKRKKKKQKPISHEFCMWQNCASQWGRNEYIPRKTKGSLLPLDLFGKKCSKESCRWNETTLHNN